MLQLTSPSTFLEKILLRETLALEKWVSRQSARAPSDLPFIIYLTKTSQTPVQLETINKPDYFAGLLRPTSEKQQQRYALQIQD